MGVVDQIQNSCFICKQRMDFFGPWEDYSYFLCAGCKTIQLSPMPSPEDLENSYRKQYLEENAMEISFTPEQWRKASMSYQQAMVDLVKKHRIKGPLLDFGAGYGFLVDLLARKGVAAFGLELSEPKLAYCRDNGLDVRNGGLDSLDHLRGSYTGVVMIAVFEHLSGHRDFLHRLHQSLPDDGVLISLHPTSSIYRYLAYLMRFGQRTRELPTLDGSFAAPWHTALVSVPAMRLLAAEAGFTVEAVERAPQGRMDGVLGLVQLLLEAVNRVGWSLLGERWPLVTSHIFLLRKQSGLHVAS